jgi:hypothetical protein
VTSLALELGNVPLIGVVDYKTQRNEPIKPTAFAELARRRTVAVDAVAKENVRALIAQMELRRLDLGA